MTGTVSISIEDFDSLRNAEEKANVKNKGLTRAAQELEVFLSFMCTRESIGEYVEEFNRQSKKSTILLEGGRAKIVFRDE